MSKRLTLLVSVVAATALLLPQTASANPSSVNVNGQQLSFVAPNDPTEVLAAADASTAPYRYANVITIGGTTIDALVSVVNVQNLETASALANNKLVRVDANSSDPALSTRLRNAASRPGEGRAVYDVQFVLAGSSTPVNLQNLAVTVRDVDNDQYVEFAALSSYVLSAGRGAGNVSAYTGSANLPLSFGQSVAATVPSGSVRFFASAGSSTSDETHWVLANFAELSTLRVTLGSYDSGVANFDIEFSAATFTSPEATVTVSRPAYTVSYDANTATGTAPAATSASSAIAVAAASQLSKPGFVFAGWNTRADGSGVAYGAGSSILPVANLTLYAQWSAAPQVSPAPSASAQAPASAALAATGTSAVSSWLLLSAGLLVAGGLALGLLRRSQRH